jgi:hypothetical protein
LAGGLNLNYDFSSKLKLESSAFYNTTDRELIREVDSEGTTATEDYRYNESTTETGTNENVRGNVKLKWTPDSLNQLIVSGNGRLNDYGETLLSSSANLSGATGDLISGGNSSTTRGSDIFSGTAGVSYTRNAGREGRSLIVTSQYKHYLTDGNDRIYNSFLVPGDPSSPYLTNQRQVRDQVQDELSSSLRYTEPLGKNTYLTARLSHDWRTEQWAKDFFDVLGETSDPEELLNDSLSLLIPDMADRLQQLNEARLCIEPDAAALAAKGATMEQIRTLRRLQTQLENAPDNAAAIEADIAAHHAIADASGNRIYRLILDSLAELGVTSRLRTTNATKEI